MTQDGSSLEDKLIQLLADYDEALAAGDTPADSAGSANAPSLQRDQAYLQLLRKALRPGIATTAPEAVAPLASNNGNEQGQPAGELPWKTLGRFEIVRELGQGGFGVVLLAWDPLLSREVALKVPRAEALLTPAFRERFDKEARAAASLDHANVVPVHEVGEAGPLCFIVSAYCPGISLSGWLAEREEPVPFDQAAGLCVALAEAVQHAHDRGVVHRDLKPSNILLVGTGEEGEGLSSLVPKITDFGLAKLVGDEGKGEQTQSGAILGTPRYMAPEQAAGKAKEVGPAADIYALGVILYELLTGRTPFIGETSLEILMQVQTAEPVSPSRLRPKVPRDLETICLKCLEKAPGRRYASAGDLADDLQRFLSGEPIRARPLGKAARLWKWARRRPAVAGLLSVTAIGALVILALGAAYLDNVTQRAEAVHDLTEARSTLRALDHQATTMKGELGTLESRIGIKEQDLEKKKNELDQVAKNLEETSSRLNLARRDRFKLTLALVRDRCEADPLGTLPLLEDPDACPPDLRDFSWGLLHRLCNRHRLTLQGPSTTVHSLAVSPDGLILVSGCGTDLKQKNGEARLWELATGRPLATLTGHSGPVNGAVFSPDGKTVATMSGTVRDRSNVSGEVKLWDTASGKERATLVRKEVAPTRVEFTPDGKTVAVIGYVSDDCFEPSLWEADTGKLISAKQIRTSHHTADCLAFNRSARQLAAVCEAQEVKLFEFPNVTTPVKSLPHDNAIGVAFAPNGTVLASASKGTVKVWDLTTGKSSASIELPHEAGSSSRENPTLTWSADGQFLIVRGPMGSTLLNPAPSSELMFQEGALKFTPDGKFVVNYGYRKDLRVWAMADLKTPRDFLSGLRLGVEDQYAGFTVVAISPDSKTLVVANPYPMEQRGAIKVWNLGLSLTPEFVPGARGTTQGAKVLELLPRDGKSNVRDAFTGRLEGTVPGAYGMNLSPDGKTVVAITNGRVKLKVLDVASGKERAILDLKMQIDTGWTEMGGRAMLFSPDSKTLVTATVNGELRLWDLDKCTERMTLAAKYGFRPPSFSPDSKLLACPIAQSRPRPAGQPPIRPGVHPRERPPIPAPPPAQKAPVAVPEPPDIILVDVVAGKQKTTLNGLQGAVALFSPSGKWLAAMGAGPARIWDLDTGKICFSLPQPSRLIFSPDDTRVVSRNGGTTQIIDLTTGKVQATIEGEMGDISFSPDGKTLLTGFRLRDPFTGQPRLQLPLAEFNQAVFSSDGRTLAVMNGGTVRLWRADLPAPVIKRPEDETAGSP
jgi:WD40 repeat protein/tRNA A-37 threonylcarbamoyl transferase component Bud32